MQGTEFYSLYHKVQLKAFTYQGKHASIYILNFWSVYFPYHKLLLTSFFFLLKNPRKYIFQYQSLFCHLCPVSLIFVTTLQLKKAGISGSKCDFAELPFVFSICNQQGFLPTIVLCFFVIFWHVVILLMDVSILLLRLYFYVPFKPALFLPCQVYF